MTLASAFTDVTCIVPPLIMINYSDILYSCIICNLTHSSKNLVNSLHEISPDL